MARKKVARKSRKPRTVYYRRKREAKTNYKKRLALLKSGKARLVIRRSNKHTIAQLVEFGEQGDKVLASATSKQLAKHGWKGSGKSLPGAYLTGLLLGKQAKIKEAVVDFGLRTPIRGSRIFSCLKGAIDAGMEIKASEEVFPPEERICGSHISDDMKANFNSTKESIQKA